MATSSPSSVMLPARVDSVASARTTSGNSRALSMPLRLHRRTPAGDTSAITRMPSHFGSMVHPSSGGSLPVGEASSGSGARATTIYTVVHLLVHFRADAFFELLYYL